MRNGVHRSSFRVHRFRETSVNIKHIAIIGAGAVGSGITQVCAASGYRVTMIDIYPQALEKGLATIQKS
ncbi:MAG: hypothetical protein HZB20_08950, partial [Chloroflexi bacterium]|nr:hypothetical protein [Chloroflexota bacterium]